MVTVRHVVEQVTHYLCQFRMLTSGQDFTAVDTTSCCGCTHLNHLGKGGSCIYDIKAVFISAFDNVINLFFNGGW